MAPLQRPKVAIQATGESLIQHFTHQHILQKLNMTFEFKCDGCNVGGNGIRYSCSACEFDLHEQCATSPHRISFHLHPDHQLVLVNRPGDSHFCYVCRGFTNGLSYTCECRTCEFDVHTLCINIPVANTGVPSVTMDRGQPTGGVQLGQFMQAMPTTSLGGFSDVQTTHPVIIQQHQHQQQQGIPITSTFDGNKYNIPSINQPMMINQQQQPKQGMPIGPFGGYDGVNNSQPMMVNHQQQQQVLPMTAFGGFQGTKEFMMMNHHLQQMKHQGIPVTAFNGYQGVNTNQMINHQQLQQQGMPTGGYNIVNNNQTVLITQQQQQQQQQQQTGSSKYTQMGKIAANLAATTLIGFPIFKP